ncbi:hypothetical protein EVAR_88040_1 [Eumeta japonica]|uniref:Uncharacterized protein n=1 Tax=Eumeta variegata TaxID=151549 RepID=A0A4C1VD44_EUMVA|nr:hypothetical protein EVAR_88040_1 [Eumeta japonica]
MGDHIDHKNVTTYDNSGRENRKSSNSRDVTYVWPLTSGVAFSEHKIHYWSAAAHLVQTEGGGRSVRQFLLHATALFSPRRARCGIDKWEPQRAPQSAPVDVWPSLDRVYGTSYRHPRYRIGDA